MVIQFLRLENLLLIQFLGRSLGGLLERRLFLGEFLFYVVVAHVGISCRILCTFETPLRSVSFLLLFDLIDNVIVMLVVFKAILQFDYVETLSLGYRLRMTHVSNVQEVQRGI